MNTVPHSLREPVKPPVNESASLEPSRFAAVAGMGVAILAGILYIVFCWAASEPTHDPY